MHVNLFHMHIQLFSREGSGWRRWVGEALAAAPALTVFTFVMAADLLFTMVALIVDHRVVTGAPVWLKPAKFALSTLIAAGSFAVCLTATTVWPRLNRVLDWLLALLLGIEILLIDMQAVRGTASHFNFGTKFDAGVFAVMGASIAVVWLSMFMLTIGLFRQSFAGSAWGWSLRLGMVLALIGTGSGSLMTVPTPQQLAAAQKTGRLTVAGAHTVGAPDGGRGLPLTGWSADHGDLRVAHFVGMHGLQVLPLLALWSGRRRRDERKRRQLVFASFVSYLALFGLILWQAFRGQSIAAPDSSSLMAFAGWLVGEWRRFGVDRTYPGEQRNAGEGSMTADALFRLCNSTALAGWLLLLVTGWSPRASRMIASLVSGLLVPALLCGVYLALIATHWRGHHGRFDSLSNVMLLFTDRWLVLAGWVHYLAFDLFIGSWQVRDARRNGVPFLLVVPCLALTFMFGPIGLLLYLLLAGTVTRGKAWPGHPLVTAS